MSTPIRTTIEARIAHVCGTLLGIGIAVAGFLANHRGVQIPCTGLTVGGALAAVSQWRYTRVVEATVSSAVAWEKENKSVFPAVAQIAEQLLPSNLDNRLVGLEDDLTSLEHEVSGNKVDEEAIAQRVIARLAAAAAPQKATATNGPVPVTGSGSSSSAAEPAPAAPAVEPAQGQFQDPPVVATP